MSKAALKKALKEIDRDGLAEIICEMYDARPEAKEYLEFWINPDADKELDKYKQKIFKLFFISEGKPRKSPGFSDIKTRVKYFTSLCIDYEKTADLMLYILDIYLLWLMERRHVLTHKPRVEKLLDETTAYLENHGLEHLYSLRLERLRNDLEEIFERGDKPSRRGWGRWWR